MILLRACGEYCPVKQKCMAMSSRWLAVNSLARSGSTVLEQRIALAKETGPFGWTAQFLAVMTARLR
jgi:hypothetical protein